jgi:hypothetical protein
MTIHLTYVNPDKRAIAIRAVSRLFIAAGMNPMKAFHEADERVHRFLNTGAPVGLLGPGVSLAHQRDGEQAFHEALTGDQDAASLSVDLSDEGPQEALQAPQEASPGSLQEIRERFLSPLPENFTPSAQASMTALVLMAMTNGNGQAAWIYAQKLAYTTGQPDLFLEVGRAYEAAFGRGDE